MDKRVKKLWVAALKSGEYAQARGSLKNGDGAMCCLGVLCDLAAKEGVGGWIPSTNTFEADIQRASVVPPDAVITWADLPKANPVAGSKSLASCNDQGTPFTKIANLINRYL